MYIKPAARLITYNYQIKRLEKVTSIFNDVHKLKNVIRDFISIYKLYSSKITRLLKEILSESYLRQC